MAKIRSLGNRELKQVLSLLARFSGDEFDYPVLERFKALYMPFHWINQFLPARFKFLPGIYVATADQQVLGLVWLSRDGYRQDRWKIDQIIINPEFYSAHDVGKQLLSYVIHKFGPMGIETFLAYVDPHYTEGLALLKDCGFRHCTKLHTLHFEGSLSEEIRHRQLHLPGLRDVRASDARKLQELHSETLVPEVRLSLRKSPRDLYPNFMEQIRRKCQGEFFRRWVVPSSNQDYLYGSVSFSTLDFKSFDLSILISPAWESGLEDLIIFALKQIAKSTSLPRISIDVYDFQKGKLETLPQLGFERTSTAEILVKDYWITLQDKQDASKSPILLFSKAGRTSPA